MSDRHDNRGIDPRIRLFAATLAMAAATSFAAEVGVSIRIGDPGFYGRIDIGGYPLPRLVYRDPIVIERVPANLAPIYLRVPPGHAKHWRRHCGEYRACDRQVYFVQDSWYSREYVPHYQERQRNHRNDDRDDSRGNRDGRGR